MDTLLRRVGDRARELVLNESIKPAHAVSKSIDELAESHALFDEQKLLQNSLATLSGFAALQPFMEDPEVEELWMNEPGQLFVCRRGKVELQRIDLGKEDVQVIIERMLREAGRRIDRSTPFVDAPLRDGSRLHAVMPDVTRRFLCFNLRRYVESKATLGSLVAGGAMTPQQAEVINNAIVKNETVFVSGATAAGKTTLLCAMLRALPADQRVISVEDTFEISVQNRDWVAMQTRPISVEGSHEIDLRRLIREALRMRPGRLVIGEVRGAEAVELLVALNSGIPAFGTVHANSAEHAITKLMTLPLLSGVHVPVDFVKLVLGSSIGLVVHCGFDSGGVRRVQEVVKVSLFANELRFESAV